MVETDYLVLVLVVASVVAQQSCQLRHFRVGRRDDATLSRGNVLTCVQGECGEVRPCSDRRACGVSGSVRLTSVLDDWYTGLASCQDGFGGSGRAPVEIDDDDTPDVRPVIENSGEEFRINVEGRGVDATGNTRAPSDKKALAVAANV